MKTKKLLPVLFVSLMLAFYGCKKSSTAPKVTYPMTFTLEGQKYNLPTPVLVTVDGANITLSAGSQGGPVMNIVINNYKSATNFELYGQTYVNFVTTPGNSYFGGTGNLTISSLTQTYISGTFSGLAVKDGDPNVTSYTLAGTFDADIPQ